MREPLKDRIRLEHILEAIDHIFQYTEGKTIQELNDNTMLFYATVKNVEIIGDAPHLENLRLDSISPSHPRGKAFLWPILKKEDIFSVVSKLIPIFANEN